MSAVDYRKLNVFNTNLLRTLLDRKGDEIINKDLYKITCTSPLEMMVRKHRLRWAGHVRRMNDDRLPKKMLFGNVVGGNKRSGSKTVEKPVKLFRRRL